MGFFGKDRKPDKISESLVEMAKSIGTLKDLVETSKEPVNEGVMAKLTDVEVRVEALEVKHATLRQECIRYLQRGAQALKKAEQYREVDEDEEELGQPPILPTLPESQPEEEMSDLEWGIQEAQKLGINPIV